MTSPQIQALYMAADDHEAAALDRLREKAGQIWNHYGCWTNAVEDGKTCAACGKNYYEIRQEGECSSVEAWDQEPLQKIQEEVVIWLQDHWSLRSGICESKHLTCGDYVRLVDPEGEEYLYWDKTEWEEDPALVMGAIINAAAGLRIES